MNSSQVLNVVALLLLATAPAVGDSAAEAHASATILSSITVGTDPGMPMEFGVIRPASASSTIVALYVTDTAAVETRDCLLLDSAAFSPADLPVSRARDATYSITLPESGAVRLVSETSEMTLTDLASDLAGNGRLAPLDVRRMTLHATLHVGANQAAGRYAGSFVVTVAYN